MQAISDTEILVVSSSPPIAQVLSLSGQVECSMELPSDMIPSLTTLFKKSNLLSLMTASTLYYYHYNNHTHDLTAK